MDERPYRLLLLEDSAADAELIVQELARAGMLITAQRVDTEELFAQALRDSPPDVIISDHALADFNAAKALRIVQAMHESTPFIVVSGALDERTVVECLKAGAEDYVLKSDLSRLVAVIQAALAVRRPLGRLSPRQREVLRLLAEGLATRAIARQLRLSVKTVETHRAEVMRRLGIRDLAGLVRYAVRVGLVRLES
ncbi:MAG TPA: response regulator transcription factor [Gemmatimonadales bacterium]|nr:response regulator transcription factor [Gemmatimonadales bacterium]